MGMSFPAGRANAQAGVVYTGAERATFVRRTYALVFASVLVTMLGVFTTLSSPALFAAVARHPFIVMALAFVPLLMIRGGDAPPARSIGFLGVFAFIEGIALTPLLALVDARAPGAIGQAAGLTAVTFALLTGYAFVSRRDFSAWGGFLTTGLWVLIGTSLLNLFFRNAVADLWIAGVGTLLFSGLLVFDTWRLRNVYGPDDYVIAAVQIYLDLLNMFMAIVRILGGGRRN